MSRTARWTLLMTFLGVSSAVVAYLVSGSWWWALAGVLGSGMVANVVANAHWTNPKGGTRP